jgi:hypothetical protein
MCRNGMYVKIIAIFNDFTVYRPKKSYHKTELTVPGGEYCVIKAGVYIHVCVIACASYH